MWFDLFEKWLQCVTHSQYTMDKMPWLQADKQLNFHLNSALKKLAWLIMYLICMCEWEFEESVMSVNQMRAG